MGTDIHVYFDKKDKRGIWQEVWKPVPYPTSWWERMIEYRCNDPLIVEVAKTCIGLEENNITEFKTRPEYNKYGTLEYNILEAYYRTIPEEEVLTKFDPKDVLVFRPYPKLGKLLACEKEWSRWFSEITQRNYSWFARLAGVRCADNGYCLWPERGFPEDAARSIQIENAHWKSDAHSHSWLMVSEILEREELSEFIHYTWLEKFVEEPEKTRMIFWFDN